MHTCLCSRVFSGRQGGAQVPDKMHAILLGKIVVYLKPKFNWMSRVFVLTLATAGS